jgi:hypothetical protein
MIVIKESIYIKDNIFNTHTRKTIRCPLCDGDVIFFDVPPIMCYSCNASLSNARRTLMDKYYRVDYHFGVAK